jgi:hypothetical protein
MKYYETNFDDYIQSVEQINMHPELKETIQLFPKKMNQLENLIIYGPPGSGKYSQALSLISRYSPSELKYDKKMTIQTEKQQYMYRISDIHYEIDMSLLGCNSKILWHEVFFQIVDIISVKPEKTGIILCKNFHLIHTELLEIFYSYMQQYNHSQTNIFIKFFIVTEHISFLPTPIIHSCHILKIKRPIKELYSKLMLSNQLRTQQSSEFTQRVSQTKTNTALPIQQQRVAAILDKTELAGITNMKELRSFQLIQSEKNMPPDIFNIICDAIIREMQTPSEITYTTFRDTLYDILTYNLDATECLWYILSYFIENETLATKDITDILIKTSKFLKYYNNNYRPIYHLESIMFTIITKLHHYDEL